MASYKYMLIKNRDDFRKSTNVVDLINRVKLEKRKEQKQTIVIATTAVSALVIAGIIISL